MIKYIVAFVFVFSLILGVKGTSYKELYCNDRDFIPNKYYPRLDCESNAFTLSVTRVHRIKFVNENGPDCSLVHEVLNDPSRFNNIRKIKVALEAFELKECRKEMDDDDEYMLELNEDDIEFENNDAQDVKCNSDIDNQYPDISKSGWESDKNKHSKKKSKLKQANYKELYCNNKHNEIDDDDKCKQEHEEIKSDNKKNSKCTHKKCWKTKHQKKKQCQDEL